MSGFNPQSMSDTQTRTSSSRMKSPSDDRCSPCNGADSTDTRRRRLSFADDLNQSCGGNESGKSSLGKSTSMTIAELGGRSICEEMFGSSSRAGFQRQKSPSPTAYGRGGSSTRRCGSREDDRGRASTARSPGRGLERNRRPSGHQQSSPVSGGVRSSGHKLSYAGNRTSPRGSPVKENPCTSKPRPSPCAKCPSSSPRDSSSGWGQDGARDDFGMSGITELDPCQKMKKSSSPCRPTTTSRETLPDDDDGCSGGTLESSSKEDVCG